MKTRVVKAIIRKDIKAIGSNIQIWLPMLLIPVIFSLVLPGVLIIPARFYETTPGGATGDNPFFRHR